MIITNNIKYFKEGYKKDIHIISAGPSIRGFNFDILRKESIMTLNNSILHLPKNIISNYHVYCEPVENEIKNYIVMSRNPRTKCFSTHECPGWIHIQPFNNGRNFAFEVAIYIAIEMGYKIINLYGYDFSVKDSYIYWWDEKKRSEEEIMKKRYILDIQKTIFKELLNKINKEIKINMITTEKIVTAGDYFNE